MQLPKNKIALTHIYLLFSIVVTLDVGSPKTLKLPWPFLVRVGFFVIGAASFLVARDVDALGTAGVQLVALGGFGKILEWIDGNVPAWGSTQFRSNYKNRNSVSIN